MIQFKLIYEKLKIHYFAQMNLFMIRYSKLDKRNFIIPSILETNYLSWKETFSIM